MSKEIVSNGEPFEIVLLDRATRGVETTVLSVDDDTGLITVKDLKVTGTLTPAIVGAPGDFAVVGNETVGGTLGVTGALTAAGVKAVAARIQGAQGADVASAGTLTLGADGNFFKITGTTAIDYITKTGWQAGSEIVLQTTGALTLNHATGTVPGTAGALKLVGSANVSMTANDVIRLLFDGTVWVQSSPVVVI